MLTVIFTACHNKKEDGKSSGPQPPENVDVIIAGFDSIDCSIETNGTVLANESVELHPETSGRLTYLNVVEGAVVNEGAILAKINDAELQAQLNKSLSQLDLAEKKELRYKKLLSVNGINQMDYDIALNELNNIKADIQLIKAQIDKTVIKSPFTGILGLRNISPGAFVTPQSVIAVVQQTNKLKLDFTLPQEYDQWIDKGSEIRVVALNDSLKHKATIIAKESSINSATGNIKYRAVINEGQFSPGAFTKVLVDVGSNKKRIMVPAYAIIPDVTSKKIIVVKNGKGIMTNVQTGIRTAYGVEITDGLAIGDSVVVNGILFVKPNADVKIRSVLRLEKTNDNSKP